MHVLAAAYKTLPLRAALHMMALQPVPAPDSHQQARTDPHGDTPLQVQGKAVGQAEQQRTEERVCLLEAVLQRVASKGNRAAAQALFTLQGQTSGGGSQVAGLHLTFKA